MPTPPHALGRSLRAWRVARRVKQAHAAEVLGVSQATVSRWESGAQVPSPREAGRLADLLAARPGSDADRALLDLVESSSERVHLICDLSHRLLAASPSRGREWGLPKEDLIGASLWRYASAAIVAAEAGLGEAGWYEPLAPALTVETGPNGSNAVPIRPGRMDWTRLRLSDGRFARLVRTHGLPPVPRNGL
ncbi:helix-turn-helix domain-containing protein [Caulobacter sp. UNC279MFTsu5.1]|uniref:helix-turn-helix domain-containing protein n=1 Tax=Caulobacter sp. UNC279MFTsu5.1 TaxID=1502775 RepID=UPI000B7C67A3|nr:helix-turn-helix transcriptional regulator [Caulobacter sp. UNC279MFTsu5.1]